MNLNLYLPDDLGRRAKAAGLPLSRLLRQAVMEELERQAAVADTLADMTEHRLDVQDAEGRFYTGRFVGREIVYDDRRDVTVYVTDDERVLVHDSDGQLWPVADPQHDLRSWLRSSLYATAMHAMGIKPVIDI